MTTLTRVVDAGSDVLQVTGLDDNGEEITATGWVSAMTNYYPPAAYDADGSLLSKSKPRAMTDKERNAYWLSLLAQVVPVEAAEPVETVLFQAPETAS